MERENCLTKIYPAELVFDEKGGAGPRRTQSFNYTMVNTAGTKELMWKNSTGSSIEKIKKEEDIPDSLSVVLMIFTYGAQAADLVLTEADARNVEIQVPEGFACNPVPAPEKHAMQVFMGADGDRALGPLSGMSCTLGNIVDNGITGYAQIQIKYINFWPDVPRIEESCFLFKRKGDFILPRLDIVPSTLSRGKATAISWDVYGAGQAVLLPDGIDALEKRQFMKTINEDCGIRIKASQGEKSGELLRNVYIGPPSILKFSLENKEGDTWEAGWQAAAFDRLMVNREEQNEEEGTFIFTASDKPISACLSLEGSICNVTRTIMAPFEIKDGLNVESLQKTVKEFPERGYKQITVFFSLRGAESAGLTENPEEDIQKFFTADKTGLLTGVWKQLAERKKADKITLLIRRKEGGQDERETIEI